MNERIKKVTTVVKDKWTGFSRAVKILIIAIPIALIAIIIILANLLNHTSDVVLYSGLTAAEAGEISGKIQEMGVNDVTVKGGEIIVPSNQADYLRMELAVQGYPKSSGDYSIWNDGLDLWSTDKDKREVMRQQREHNIAVTLAKLKPVREATVLLDVPETRDYVITQKEEVPRCSITLTLREDEELTNEQVRAIFATVSNAVEGLTYDNISVVDTQGRPYEWISKEEEEALGTDKSGVPIAKKRWEFQRLMRDLLMQDLKSFLEPIYGAKGYSISVGAWLNYDAKTVEEIQYYPVEGTDHGVLEQEDKVNWYNSLGNTGGIPGVTTNGDQSPEYPTLDGLEDGQAYYYNKDQKQYDVSNIKTKIEKDGYEIERLTVGVAVDANSITEAQREAIETVVMNAVAATSVSVMATPFALPSAPGTSSNTGIFTQPVDPYRNMLLFLVIVLGVVLIALLIVSLCMGHSRKKKIRRRQEQALIAAQSAAEDINGGFGMEHEAPEEIDFNIASLTEEAGKDSRETILKREIAEFARSSPDIVASIIKNMLRDES